MKKFPGFKVKEEVVNKAQDDFFFNQPSPKKETVMADTPHPEQSWRDTQSSLYSEYIKIRQRVVSIMLAEGSEFTDLELIVDIRKNTEYLWNKKLRFGWKFTQEFTDMFKDGKAELRYVAERVTSLPK